MKKLLLLFFFPALTLAQISPPKLGPPVHVKASATTHSAVLSCTAGSGDATFNFFRATTSGGQVYTSPINSSPTPTCAYTDTAVSAGTTYYYTAEGISGSSTSAPSNQASGTIPVFAPSGTALTISGTTGTVTWTASTDSSAAYNVYVGTSSGGESSTASNSSPVDAGCSGSACTYTLSSLTPGQTYYVEVKATINGVLSAASNEASGTAAPNAPLNLTITVN